MFRGNIKLYGDSVIARILFRNDDNVARGNNHNNTFIGKGGDDALYGYGGADSLGGGDGADTLDGGSGQDVMAGGDGDDLFEVNSAGDVIKERPDEGVDTVSTSISYVLRENLENLVMSGEDDLDATGNGGNNTITGNGGENTLNGGAGADSLIGGGGNDAYFVDNANDKVTEAGNGGRDLVRSQVSYTLATNVEILMLVGDRSANATGNSANNTLFGNQGSNTLNGAAGADTMTGQDGNDVYVVDAAGDRVSEDKSRTSGVDTVLSSVSYTLSINVEKLQLSGTGNLNGTGNASANTLTGNKGHNSLDGGSGADTLMGLEGNDTYVIDNVGDGVKEDSRAGTDTVLATISYTLGKNLENLTLNGSAALDGMGNELANTLTGNKGANQLVGGKEDDILTGGGGADLFGYGALAEGGDKITDFSSGQKDKLQFLRSAFGNLATGTLSSKLFVANATGTATDSAQRFVFNTRSGVLSFDSNGKASGGVTVIATLNVRSLSASDIQIVSKL